LALVTLAGDALALGLFGEQVALVTLASERQPELLGDHPGSIDLPAAAQVGQQRYQVAAFVPAGEVVPGAGARVDAEAARSTVAAYRIGRPVLHTLAGAIRQPVGEQRVGLLQGGVGNALNLDVAHCRPSGALWLVR